MKSLSSLCSILVILALTPNTVRAEEYCSPWRAERGVSCSLPSSENGEVWTRKCPATHPKKCKAARHRVVCLSERLCTLFENPQQFKDICTEWRPVYDVSCSDGSMKWYRICKMEFISTSSCSNTDPNLIF